MKQKMHIGQILMASTMLSLVSSELTCYSDFLDVVTCDWNTSSLEDRFHITPKTNCSLHSLYKVSPIDEKPQSYLERPGNSQTELHKGTLQFSHEILKNGPLKMQLSVMCEHMTEPVETINFCPRDNVKLYPPTKPVVEGPNVTWQLGSPHSSRVRDWRYEVQWDLLHENWKNHWVADILKEYFELPEDRLIRGKQYVIRVRSIPQRKPQFWSEWSPVTQWTSTVGEEPPTDIREEYTMIPSASIFMLAIPVIFLAFICIPRNRRISKCLYVPTPGKYFGDLFSDHGGDFKSWLGPIVNPEMYIIADSESISPVTIYKACNSDTVSDKMEKDISTRDGNTSSFSNSTYFLSQSSKCATIEGQLEPCSTDCPYGPSGGGSVQDKILAAIHDNSNDSDLSEVSMSSPLETSSSYKQLQKLRLDIQSPDSGFAGSSEEQESQEESGSEGLPSPPVVGNTLPSNCILSCPMPQLIGLPHLGIPPGLAWSPWNNTTLPHDVSRSLPWENSGIMACSGMLEPSSDDYMPVKKVQE